MASATGVSDTGGDHMPPSADAGIAGSTFLAVRDRLGDWTVVRLASTLDAASASSLRDLFTELADGDAVQVLVDLSAVPFIDSAGLGVLIGACRRLRALDGDMRLAGPRPHVSSVLRMTGISRVIQVYNTVDDALSDLAPH